jgi:hypothetical protein
MLATKSNSMEEPSPLPTWLEWVDRIDQPVDRGWCWWVGGDTAAGPESRLCSERAHAQGVGVGRGGKSKSRRYTVLILYVWVGQRN